MRIILISLMVTGTALAGGKGGHGSIADLIPPAVNFFILVTFLVIKLKAPIRNLFIKKAEAISETLERANVKSKEAQVMLETQQKKLSNLDNVIEKNEEAFKDANKAIQSSISELEKEYPRGQLNLEDGTVTYNPAFKAQMEQQMQSSPMVEEVKE